MKWPKQVTVLGKLYRVSYVRGLMERDECEGFCAPAKFEIVIDRELLKYPEYARRTFYHEVGHAFAIESGLHETLSADSIEMFCQAFSSFICSLKK